MSKTVYLVELIKAPNTSSKFKFAIDNSKKSIKELKDEIKQKLLQKNELEKDD